MKRKILFIFALIGLLGSFEAYAQNVEYKFKEVIFSYIPGAVRLSQPQFLAEENGNLLSTGKRGLIGVGVIDVNGDKVLDLIAGEFGMKRTDNYLKIYINKGTNKKPRYADKGEYLNDINGEYLTIDGY